MDVPIIFIHYGDSDYLKYTLLSARKTNPGKRVILLGDEHNAHFKNKGVEHISFCDFDNSEELEVFDKHFKIIAPDGYAENGTNKNKTYWTSFVFRRLYILSNFVRANGITRFWTFDSDTMIVRNLEEFEDRLSGFDNTEQCDGICMNGFIANAGILRQYVDDMNRMFQDRELMEKQKVSLKDAPVHWAFTEMRAYEIFKSRNNFKSILLSQAIPGVTFDNAICHDHGMEMQTTSGIVHKKIWIDNGGTMYFRQKVESKLVKVATLNLSWVPLYFFANIYKWVDTRIKGNDLKKIDFREPRIDSLLTRYKMLIKKMKT